MSRQLKMMSYGARRSAGLTLIELMVAMVLSLLLMGGVLTIFASTKTTSQLQSGLATVQENGRHALHLLVRDIRGAGFTGCGGIEPTMTNVIAKNWPGKTKTFEGEEVIWGIDDFDPTDPNKEDPVQPYNAVPGTDVVRVRGAGDGVAGLVGNTVAVNANIQTTKVNHLIKEKSLVLITDCQSADYFRATNVSNGGGKTTIAHACSDNEPSPCFLSKPYGQDAFILKYRSNTYFIRDTLRTNSAGQPILGLFWRDETKVSASFPKGEEQELVDGVEDMQITYGVDTDGNGFVDRFMDAGAVESGSLWQNVLAVQIALLMSSVDNASSTPVPYTFVGVASTPVVPDLRLRQEMVSTVTLRNRVE